MPDPGDVSLTVERLLELVGTDLRPLRKVVGGLSRAETNELLVATLLRLASSRAATGLRGCGNPATRSRCMSATRQPSEIALPPDDAKGGG